MSEAHGEQRIGRSIGAILAGVLTVVVLSIGTDAVLHGTGVFPPWGQPMSDALFVLATAYRTVYGIVGGYVVALLAPSQPMRLALRSGFVGLVLSTTGVIATWNQGPEFGPKWYSLALVASAMPCAWAGAKLHAIRANAVG